MPKKTDRAPTLINRASAVRRLQREVLAVRKTDWTGVRHGNVERDRYIQGVECALVLVRGMRGRRG